MIGVLGGTFSPIHNGHLRIATAARRQLGLAEVRLIPAAAPPLRAAPAIPAARRLRWVKLATAGQPRLVVDDREINRHSRASGNPVPSYTVDTLLELRREHPRAALCLLLGQDAARQLPRWHRWRALTRLAHLVFFHRPGHPATLAPELARHLRGHKARSVAQLRARPAGLWWRCAMPPVPVSSTQVRQHLRASQSVTGLVPAAVVADFNKKDLEAFRR